MRIWALCVLRVFLFAFVTITLVVLIACGGRGLVPLPSGSQTQNAESGYRAGTSKGPQPGSGTDSGSSTSPPSRAGDPGSANTGGSSGAGNGTGGKDGSGNNSSGNANGGTPSTGGLSDNNGESSSKPNGGSSGGQTSTGTTTPPTPSAPAPAPPPHYVLLEWQRSPSSVMGYNIYRGTHKGGPYQKLNKEVEPATTYTDHSVVAGGKYFYVITSVDASKEGPYSNEATAAVPSP